MRINSLQTKETMNNETEMFNSIPERLRYNAEVFHGHLGPFLVLGLKAGLVANKILGRNPFETRAIVETELKPPCSCFIDGIQFSTGCTMGKANIELREKQCLSVVFVKNGGSLRLELKRDILDKLKRITVHEEIRRMALDLSEQPVKELFIIDSKKTEMI